jgi:transcription elongation GreA/GreB family factor
MQDLQESAANETKSSAGDKYETGRAMLHIEQDQLRRQLAEIATQEAVLQSIDPEAEALLAHTGSLLKVNAQYYFLSVALGKLTVEGQLIIALSIQSPLGARLKGLRMGERVDLNGRELLVEGIW